MNFTSWWQRNQTSFWLVAIALGIAIFAVCAAMLGPDAFGVWR